MKKRVSERKLAENEVIFRELNEHVQEAIDKLNEMAEESSQPESGYTQTKDDAPLHFHCECSNDKCFERIPIKHEEYSKIHKNRKHFIVVKGHEIGTIERTIKEMPNYLIVEKNILSSKEADSLLNPVA